MLSLPIANIIQQGGGALAVALGPWSALAWIVVVTALYTWLVLYLSTCTDQEAGHHHDGDRQPADRSTHTRPPQR
jgi:hypothetical protein